MASFSDTHPLAYHVFPLTAARAIWRAGALHGKDDLGASGQIRRTTGDLDRSLGFSRFVHFYLPPRGAAPEDLPILSAQLQPSVRPACPHAMLVVPTAPLADEVCTICNWNIAVSRPAVPGLCQGGNWTRGTNPQRIQAVWQAFRAMNPAPETARGFWAEFHVPIIAGSQIAANLRLLGRAPRKMPELLLASPARVFAHAKVLAFSRADLASLRTLGSPPDGAVLELRAFSGYDPDADPLGPRRRTLDDYLAGRNDVCPAIDFDAIRPRT